VDESRWSAITGANLLLKVGDTKLKVHVEGAKIKAPTSLADYGASIVSSATHPSVI